MHAIRRDGVAVIILSLVAALAVLAAGSSTASAGARGLTAVGQAMLTAPDGGPGDLFGLRVGISGDTAVVGAPDHDVGAAAGRGAAYVFTRSGTGWTLQATLTAADGAAGDRFGRAVAISGDTIVVTAPYDTVGANVQQGSAYVFTRSGTTWSQQAKLTAADGEALEWFGMSGAAIESDTVVIGSDYADDGGQVDEGAVYVFTRSGAAWSQQAKLIAPDLSSGAHLGLSVALSGDTVVAGAFGASPGGKAYRGAAYIFVRSGASWSLQRRLVAAEGTSGDQFGSSVAISGDTVVVGANQADLPGAPARGAAYVFTRSGVSWTRQARLVAADGARDDYFAHSVAVGPGVAVVGAPWDDIGRVVNRGSLYVFKRSGTTWKQHDKALQSGGSAGDRFGYSLALSGATGVTGALHDDVGGDADQGSAHVFVLMEKPGRPVAVSPSGRVDVAPPTFQWSRAIRAATYEVRVYRGTRLVLKHAGVRVPATSWVCDSRLPRRVDLTWKVRARNAAGFGLWSKSLLFRLR